MWGLAVLPPTACALNAAQQQMGALPLPVQPQLTAPGASQGAGSFGDWHQSMPPQAPERGPGPEQLGQSSAVVQEQALDSAAAATAVPSLPSAEPTADGAADAAAAEVIDLTLDNDDGDDDEPADCAAGPAAVPGAAAATMARLVRALDAELRADVPPKALPQAGDAVQPPSGLQGSPGRNTAAAQHWNHSSTAASHDPPAPQRGSTAVLTAREGQELFVPSSLADASVADAPSWLPLTLLLEHVRAVKEVPAILRAGIVQQPQGPLLRQYCIPAKGVSELLGLSSKRDSLGRLHIRFTARCTLRYLGIGFASILQHHRSTAGSPSTYACHLAGTGSQHVPESDCANYCASSKPDLHVLARSNSFAGFTSSSCLFKYLVCTCPKWHTICRSQAADKCGLFLQRA